MSLVRSPCRILSMRKHRGFSLPEIVVALGCTIALASAAGIGSEVIMKSGRYNAAKTGVAAISIAVSQYRHEMGTYPENLMALTSADETVGKGPWLHTDNILDPWHNDYQYYANGNEGFAIWSLGPDGQNNSGDPTTEFNTGGNGDDIGIFGR